ncbi:hypothetical protein K435DRAFT_675871 [Dendrothele bispora CBS 962.96]|uniref:Uncharacterized protein n=1 Tax=Dendrothele bispora (strain CBS 962.96) TaxID=1314807 RepID=A0A4S8LMU1_DENBC|nr:hypothetical protein K435DRAFT_675871 [Dendrothele bispora CBS 962.96]
MLAITNSAGNSTDTVMVDIVPNTVDHITLETVSWKSGKGSGTLTVIASTDNLSAMLFVSVRATNPDVSTLAMTSLGSGRWQALVSMRPAPATVTVTSNLGGFASTATIAHG